MYSGYFSNLTLGKAGQLPESLGVCRNTSVLVDLAFVVDLVIYRALLHFSLYFLPTIFEVCGDDVTALQDAARPGVTGISIWSSKLAFWVIEVLVENFSIAFDRDAAVPAISDCDA